jgi:hypothetical protein
MASSVRAKRPTPVKVLSLRAGLPVLIIVVLPMR